PRPPLHGSRPEPPGPDQPLLPPSLPQPGPGADPPPTGAHRPQEPLRAAGEGAGGGRGALRIGLVVQRYGLEVVGGAELHCRWVAEHLAERHQVEVLTTTATDYLNWENEFPPGVSTLNGVTVRRFPVERRRRIDTYDAVANKVCFFEHTDEEERRWMEEHG